MVPPIPEDEEEELSDFVCARLVVSGSKIRILKEMHAGEKLDFIFACLPHLSFFQAHILALRKVLENEYIILQQFSKKEIFDRF